MINQRVQSLPSSLKAHLFHFKSQARAYRRNKANPSPLCPPPNLAMVCTSLQKAATEGTAECQGCPGWSHTAQMPHPGSSTGVTHMRSGLKRWMMAHRARPLFQEVVRSVTFTFLYPSVCFWHHVKSLLGRISDSAQTGEQGFSQLLCAQKATNVKAQQTGGAAYLVF